MYFIFLSVLLTTPITHSYDAEFVRCYDGDTCYFNIILEDRETNLGFGIFQRSKTFIKEQHIRLCDINAPEMRGDTHAQAVQSRDMLISWILSAKKIKLLIVQKKTCDAESSCDTKEKYGRWLGYIYADDISLNQRMIDAHLATPYIMCQ